MKEPRRLAAFVLVGSAAAAVHWCVVVALVEHLALRPLTANVSGWLVALWVSFAGHRGLTFRDRKAPVQRSLPRFAAVSAIGFALNQASYAVLLRHADLSYSLALAAVLVAVALLTYLASRYWAFLGS